LDLPVNKRFFPGGDNSIRGYREGEAAPLGPDGTLARGGAVRTESNYCTH